MFVVVCCNPTSSSPHSHLCRDLHLFLNVLNNDGMSPLTLAASLGHKVMFSHILERSKMVHWTWGPVSCTLYPIAGLDLPPQAHYSTQSVDERPAPRSALDHLIDEGACGWLLLPCMRAAFGPLHS